MNFDYKKYANLLANYSLEIKKGDRLLVNTTYLAEPLLQALSEAVYKAGGTVDFQLSFNEQAKIALQNSEGKQLDHVSPLRDFAFRNYEAYLYIMAPFNLSGGAKVSEEKSTRAKKANSEIQKIYSQRTATRDLKRSLCVFPNLAMAQKAGKSLSDYQEFVFNACKLNTENPIDSWLEVRKNQQDIVDVLNKAEKISYKNNNGTDITFKTKGRTWINSDGQTNMPSGEVYTSPEEDSVNGVIYFNMPSVYWNGDVQGVTLEVKDGEVQKWHAKIGQNILDAVMKVKGARRFGEAAIGTNYSITEITKNTLFDEKMGGTVHMALGQSYLQAGGKNESSVHWDLITDMKDGGEIFANDELIYKNGKFCF